MAKAKHSGRPKDFKEPEKIAKGQRAAESISAKKFRWTTCTCDFEDPFGWSKIGPSDLHLNIIPKLQNFETQTWYQIENQSNGDHHFSDVSNFSEDARKRLAEIESEKNIIYSQLFSLHLDGKLRIWGMRDNDRLEILWWDPNHEVYPVKKDQGDKRKFNRRKAKSIKDRNRNK